MELWIRSQDKNTLMKVNRIDVQEKNIICYDNDYHCNETYMGIYKTKERALEILDEIQKKIKNLLYLKPTILLPLDEIQAAKEYFEKFNKQEFVVCDKNFEIIPISCNAVIYEMPEN